MSIELIIVVTIWLIFGVLSAMNMYYTFLKDWYLQFNEDYRLYQGGNTINSVKYMSPLLILCGLTSFILLFIMFKSFKKEGFCYYYKIPNE